MILDGDVARRISAGDFGPWGENLTLRERERLVSQATDVGLALSRKLHKCWRLTKLLTLLPVTIRVGDPDLLSDLVDIYWRHHLPEGLYFEAEAERFAAFVAEQVPTSSLLHDAACLEAALLAVGRRSPSMQRGAIDLHLAHDPRRLLADPSDGSSVNDGGFDITVTASAEGPRLIIHRCTGVCAARRAAARNPGGQGGTDAADSDKGGHWGTGG
jgi:hypothetical protein